MSALVQQSEEWLEKRRSMVGASDAPIIMGVNPWSTQYKLWQEKLKLIEPRQKTQAMQRGLNREEEARMAFINQTGILVAPDVVFHAENAFMMASLDGISDDKKDIVEIKCPGDADHEIAKNGAVPEKYYPQLQHQLEVCQLDMVYYFSYKAHNDFSLIKVNRDDKYIKRMVPAEKEFWLCLQEFIAPKLTERDYEIKDDESWQHAASQWLSISKRLKELESVEKQLRELLILQSTHGNSKGAGVKVAKIIRKGNVDYAQIPELKDVNLDRYRKAHIESWRISED